MCAMAVDAMRERFVHSKHLFTFRWHIVFAKSYAKVIKWSLWYILLCVSSVSVRFFCGQKFFSTWFFSLLSALPKCLKNMVEFVNRFLLTVNFHIKLKLNVANLVSFVLSNQRTELYTIETLEKKKHKTTI